ncbi:MAG: hypothetical protein JWN70_4632 [Planctomycetaceae bacterium]|nr:hypothetical protein [Planctomycetaceae bacterium]
MPFIGCILLIRLMLRPPQWTVERRMLLRSHRMRRLSYLEWGRTLRIPVEFVKWFNIQYL